LTTVIESGGTPIALERARLAPAVRPLDDAARLGRFSHFATFYVCREGESASTWTALEQSLAASLDASDAHWGVSTLVQDGVVIRGLAGEGRHLQRGLFQAWRIAKLALYGTEPAPPRKVP